MNSSGIVLIPTDNRHKPIDHNGNLAGEIMDIIQPLGDMNRVLIECEQGNIAGAVGALKHLLDHAMTELKDLEAKVIAEGIFQQSALFPKQSFSCCPGEKKAPRNHPTEPSALPTARLNAKIQKVRI